MTGNSDLHADDIGQVVGVSHHDGSIEGINFGKDSVDINISSSYGEKNTVCLVGVRYFIANGLREGNVVDRMYLWDAEKAPDSIMKRVMQALSIDLPNVMQERASKNSKIFLMECSYGAEIFSVLHHGIQLKGPGSVSDEP
ncbi:hypothetical protein [Pseudoxanthomonas sp.]|jgi:hypothetical protein|uniref:hypothetical protein n=1 Tax=Pseudoxanthomonas sp. TaxID=1871049 RepID=UPI002FE13271